MKRGNLFKWTNYLSGWQCRYVVVERGTLSYYRNELDMEFGCRGVIHLGKLFQNLSFAILDLYKTCCGTRIMKAYKPKLK